MRETFIIVGTIVLSVALGILLLGWQLSKYLARQPSQPQTVVQKVETLSVQSRPHVSKVTVLIEYTQSAVALVIVMSLVFYEFEVLVTNKMLSPDAARGSTILADAFYLIIGFYFGRTNPAIDKSGVSITQAPTEDEDARYDRFTKTRRRPYGREDNSLDK